MRRESARRRRCGRARPRLGVTAPVRVDVAHDHEFEVAALPRPSAGDQRREGARRMPLPRPLLARSRLAARHNRSVSASSCCMNGTPTSGGNSPWKRNVAEFGPPGAESLQPRPGSRGAARDRSRRADLARRILHRAQALVLASAKSSRSCAGRRNNRRRLPASDTSPASKASRRRGHVRTPAVASIAVRATPGVDPCTRARNSSGSLRHFAALRGPHRGPCARGLARLARPRQSLGQGRAVGTRPQRRIERHQYTEQLIDEPRQLRTLDTPTPRPSTELLWGSIEEVR